MDEDKQPKITALIGNTASHCDLRPIKREEPLFQIRMRNGKSIPIPGPSKFKPNPRICAKTAEAYDRHPRFRRRRLADTSYNCHGLTLLARLGCIAVPEHEYAIVVAGEKPPDCPDCVDEYVRLLLQNAGYRCIKTITRNVDVLTASDDIQQGDVIVYKRWDGIQHTGIVWACSPPPAVTVLSKLGDAGEYFHPYQDAPDEYGSIVEFWTDRENIKCLVQR